MIPMTTGPYDLVKSIAGSVAASIALCIVEEMSESQRYPTQDTLYYKRERNSPIPRGIVLTER